MRKPSKAAISAGIEHAKKHKTETVVGWSIIMSLRSPAQTFWPSRGKKFTKAAKKEFRGGTLISPNGSTFDLL